MEEGEVVTVPEGGANRGRVVRVTAGSVACWEGDVEVRKASGGDDVGEGEGPGLCDPCVERTAEVG